MKVFYIVVLLGQSDSSTEDLNVYSHSSLSGESSSTVEEYAEIHPYQYEPMAHHQTHVLMMKAMKTKGCLLFHG